MVLLLATESVVEIPVYQLRRLSIRGAEGEPLFVFLK
jgi:hypothetical protein